MNIINETQSMAVQTYMPQTSTMDAELTKIAASVPAYVPSLYTKAGVRSHARELFAKHHELKMRMASVPIAERHAQYTTLTCVAPGVYRVGDSEVAIEAHCNKPFWKKGEKLRKDVCRVLMTQNTPSGPKASYVPPSAWNYVNFDTKTEVINKEVQISVNAAAVQHLLHPELREHAMRLGSFLSYLRKAVTVVQDVAQKVMPVMAQVGQVLMNPETGVMTVYMPVRATRMNANGLGFDWGPILNVGMGILGNVVNKFVGGQTIKYGSPIRMVNGVELVAVGEAVNVHHMAMAARARAAGGAVRGFPFSLFAGLIKPVVGLITNAIGADIDAPQKFAKMGVRYVGLRDDGSHEIEYDVPGDAFEIVQGEVATTAGDNTPLAVEINVNPEGPERVGGDEIYTALCTAGTDEEKTVEFDVNVTTPQHLVGAKLVDEDILVGALTPSAMEESGESYMIAPSLVGTTGFDSTEPGEEVVTFQLDSLQQGTESKSVELEIIDEPVPSIIALATKLQYGLDAAPEKDKIVVVMGGGPSGVSDQVADDAYDLPNWDSVNSTEGYKDVIVQHVNTAGQTLTTTINIYFGNSKYLKLRAVPQKVTFNIGEMITIDDVEIYGTRPSGQEDLLKKRVTLSGFDSMKVGPRQVTATYTGKTGSPLSTVFEVNITDPIIDLEITPLKTTYPVGAQFNSAELTVEGITRSGQKVTLDVRQYDVTGFITDTVGDVEVFVMFRDEITITQSYHIMVQTTGPLSLSVTLDRDEYFKGEAFDQDSAHFMAVFANDGEVEVPQDAVTMSGFNSSTAGVKNLTFGYGGKTTTAQVTVLADPITSIRAEVRDGFKASVGKMLDTDAIDVFTVSQSGDSEQVTDWDYLGFDPLESGMQTITITYGSFTTICMIEVERPVFTSMSVEALKTEFEIGEEINKSLLDVKFFDADGAVRVADSSEYVVNVPDMIVPDPNGTVIDVVADMETGEHLVGRFTAYFTKGGVPHSGYLVIENSKKFYNQGDDFDEGSIGAYLVTADGDRTQVNVSVTGFNSSKSGECILTVNIQ
jgi:ethanolamine utilization microcompartment shell protein EutL/ketosteroid isomerase-like protein